MSSLRRIALAACLLLAAPAAGAQQLPTPEQVRRGIATSGLTPDQIRARLRASGYPEDLLDSYLRAPRAPRAPRDSVAAPDDAVLEAVAALGIGDSTDAPRPVRRAPRDTARSAADSLVDEDSLPARADSLVDSRADADPDRAPARPAARRARDAADSGQAIFGLDVFASRTTQFDPNLAGPVDASYRLGPGDRLVLLVTGDAERAFTLDVTREGFVVIPGVGELPVASLTLGQLDDLLYARLGRVYSGLRRGPGATTRFSVHVARLHSNQVYVLGDVEQPGSYRVSSAGTALTALYAAGGPTPNGSLRRVEIRRGGRLVDTLDLYDYLLRADGSHDPRLQSGDVVFVPVHGARVRVVGAVVRPATYELRPGESLADALSAAGGYTAEAVRRRVQVSRILPPDERDTTDRARVVIDVDLVTGIGARATEPGGRAAPDPRYPNADARLRAVPLEPGDVVRVFAVSDRVGRRVAVKGDVWSPGVVGLTPGMRLSDAVRMAGGLKPDAYLGQVLVSRLRPGDSTRVQLRSAFHDVGGRAVDDLVLREDDEVRVFSVSELRPNAHIAITGAVRRPGRYAYRAGMTLRDLVLLAGGLEAHAYLDSAEIAAPASDGAGVRLAASRRVPLDSSYLLAGDAPRVAAEVPLDPYANVLILARPDWERPRRVVVAGEVRFPGTYTLLSRDERLSDLLRRAGGPTAAAHADGIVFYRRQRDVGRVGVDRRRVQRHAGSRDDLLLQDGDSVYLPAYAAVVEVQGAVNAPRAVAWVPGAKLSYYVNAAGGGTRRADLQRAYVTQPDGSVESVVARRLLPDAVPVPEAGSVVYVTEHDRSERPTDSVARLAVLAQVLGGLVTLAAILTRR